MKLFTCRGAPHAMRVQLYVAEKSARGACIALEPVEVDLRRGENRSATHLARIRAGVVPVLETGAGEYLGESLAIIEYLEECHPAPSLWGATPLDRGRQRELDRIAELRVLRPHAQWVHATQSPLGMSPDPVAAARHGDAVGTALVHLDAVLRDSRSFLGGEHCSVADCTLAAGLDFALKRGYLLPPECDALAAWQHRFWQRHGGTGLLRWSTRSVATSAGPGAHG